MKNKEEKNALLGEEQEGEEKEEVKKSTPPVETPTPKPSAPKDSAKINEENMLLTKEKLLNGPKMSMIIPLSEGEKAGAYDTVQINGYGMKIQKGVLVELPVPVAKLLAEKYRIQIEAGKDKRVDRDAATQAALG
jgi:hypothetical protein